MGVSTAAVVLAGCSSGSPTEGDIEAGMGNATPVPASAPASVDSAQSMVKKISANIDSVVLVGDRVVLTAGDKVFAGPLNNPTEHSMKLSSQCGELAPGGNAALLPCEDGIHVLTGEATEAAVVGQKTAYSAAVGLSDGRIIGAQADSSVIDVFGSDGEKAGDFKAANTGSQLVSVPSSASGSAAKLIEVNRAETSVHELKLDESRAGSALRAGIGVGRAAAGDHVIAAADTKGNQVLIYTATDVIRLHQASPAPESPWAVGIDDARGIVWVTSTKANKLTGYDISSGTPIQVAQFNTVSDPQSLVITEDGRIAVFSATGGGAQVFDTANVDKQIAQSRAEAKAQREEMSVREPEDKLPTGTDDSGEVAGSEGEAE